MDIKVESVKVSEANDLLKIGRQTFYNTFRPPINTPQNIEQYFNEKFTL